MLFKNGKSIHNTSQILRHHFFDYEDESYEDALEKYYSGLKEDCPISNYMKFDKYLHDGKIINFNYNKSKLRYNLVPVDAPEIKLQITYEGINKFHVYRINRKGYPVKCSKKLKPKEFLYDEISILDGNIIEHAVIFWIGKDRRGSLIWIFHAKKIDVVSI